MQTHLNNVQLCVCQVVLSLRVCACESLMNEKKISLSVLQPQKHTQMQNPVQYIGSTNGCGHCKGQLQGTHSVFLSIIYQPKLIVGHYYNNNKYRLSEGLINSGLSMAKKITNDTVEFSFEARKERKRVTEVAEIHI